MLKLSWAGGWTKDPKNKAGGITLPEFRQYCKATAMKTVEYWHKNRHKHQWTRIKRPEINPHLWSINLWQGRQKYKMGKRQPLHQVALGNWTAACKAVKLEHNVTPYAKINAKWLKILSINHDIITLLEESKGKIFSDINCTNVFRVCLPRQEK